MSSRFLALVTEVISISQGGSLHCAVYLLSIEPEEISITALSCRKQY